LDRKQRTRKLGEAKAPGLPRLVSNGLGAEHTKAASPLSRAWHRHCSW